MNDDDCLQTIILEKKTFSQNSLFRSLCYKSSAKQLTPALLLHHFKKVVREKSERERERER
jgi:hypothetical protein